MAGFSFAKYFGDINLLADLQFLPGEKPFIDRPSTAHEPKDLLLYLGCNILRTAHLARTVILVLKAIGIRLQHRWRTGPLLRDRTPQSGRQRRLPQVRGQQHAATLRATAPSMS